MTAIELDLPPFAIETTSRHAEHAADRVRILAELGRCAAGALGQACAAAGAMALLAPPVDGPDRGRR